MTTHRFRTPRPLLAAALLLALGAGLYAQEVRLPVSAEDTLRTVLQRQTGKPVTLKLDSGEEISGKVRLVGDRIVHLEELTGKEFFDAVVDLEEVAAVLVRTR